MQFSAVRAVINDTPHTTPERGRQLYDHVLEHDIADVLELGFAHGTATSYLAAALDERGGGRITSIDRPESRARIPSAWDLIAEAGLERYVDLVVASSSYTWELMHLIQRQTRGGVCEPCFDFVFIDGAHTWEVDGFAFFLVEKLLRPGGWLLFDDVSWTFESSPSLRTLDWVQALPEDQRRTPQIERVFGLLVHQHPGFTDRRLDGDWAWARKLPDDLRGRATKLKRAITGRM